MGRHNDHSPSAVGAEDRRRELARAHRQYKIARYRSLIMHWLGRWLRRPKRANVTPLPTVVPGQVGISFSGHATVLLRYANRNIVCDPMLGKWVKGVKRAVMPGLTPADLHDVDIILISHAHQDHLHRPTLAALPKSATVILPPRTAQFVSDLGFARVVELSPDQSIQDHGVDIATARVHHGDETSMTMSYIIRGDGPSVYFCGDSGYFPGFARIGQDYAPDIALLPIGGYAPLSFRERHMSPLDALYALEDLGSRVMIPIHHGAFSLSYERLDEPVRWLVELVHERGLEDFVIPMEPGESRVFVPPSESYAHAPWSARSMESSAVPSGAADADDASADAASTPLVPALVHALPAMRAVGQPGAVVAVGPSLAPTATVEPAWVQGTAGRVPQFADLMPARPAFDLALEKAAEHAASSNEFVAVDDADGVPMVIDDPVVDRTDEVPMPEGMFDGTFDPAPPDALIVEPVSAVHSDPIELARKGDWDELVDDLMDRHFADVAMADDATPEAGVHARCADRERISVALETSAPVHRVLSESLCEDLDAGLPDAEGDAVVGTADPGSDPFSEFDLHAALRDHFQRFPQSRLRARISSDGDGVPDALDERLSDRISRGHRLGPIPALA